MLLSERLKSAWANRYMRYGSIAALVVLSLIVFYRKGPVQTEVQRVTRGTFEAFVEEDGVSRVREKFTVYSPAAGVMTRFSKHPGDVVSKGLILTHVMLDYMRPVRAPASGTILKVHRESEGPIEMGAPIVDIGDTSQLEIVSEVLTRDVVRMKAGNDVTITGWGGQLLNGKIRIIEPSAFTKISTLGVEEQRVRVLVDFDRPKEMGEGFQVRCRLIGRRETNRIILPVGALFREGENWTTYRVVKGRAAKTQVKIIESSSNQALVESGVTEGDEVILFPGEKIREGVKVR